MDDLAFSDARRGQRARLDGGSDIDAKIVSGKTPLRRARPSGADAFETRKIA